jgi:hypothetical protein
MSASEKREKGKPRRDGDSQARAFTWTTTLGGKAGFAPASRLLFESRQSELEETLSPFADDLSRQVEARRNNVVRKTLRGVENDLGSDNISIW